MITIVDYGVGNVRAIANIYNRLGISVAVACTADELARATRIVLPGVGAFDWAMERLIDSGMRETLDDLVRHEIKPVLGICVGMQMMAQRSAEGSAEGLGWFDAEVKLFDESKFVDRALLPQIGWNDVKPNSGGGLFRGLEVGARFYFLHSYYFAPRQPEDVLATTDYGGRFASAVRHNNIYGVQFHPEKSHQWGIQLLKNFAEI